MNGPGLLALKESYFKSKYKPSFTFACINGAIIRVPNINFFVWGAFHALGL